MTPYHYSTWTLENAHYVFHATSYPSQLLSTFAFLPPSSISTLIKMLHKKMTRYSSIPGNRNWQIETADWNLDVRLDILGFRGKKTLYKRRNIA